MRRFGPRGASFMRDLLSGRAAIWPDLSAPDMSQLLRALGDHGAAPLACDALGQGLAEGVPREVEAPLREAYVATAMQNDAWIRERGRVVSALRGESIDGAVLKGAALMDTVYEAAALRPVVDIDVLVDADVLARAVEVLVGIGYRQVVSDADENRHHAELRARGPSGMPVAVELHRRLFASPPYDRVLPTADVLRRARDHDDGVTRLAPVDNLLHLAGHLVLQHARGERLVWVADIDRLARAHIGDDVFWDETLSQASECMLTRSLTDAVALARLWFETPIRPDIAGRMADLVQTEQEATAYRRLRRRAPVGEEGARLLDDVRGVPGLAAKLRFVASHLAPPPAAMRSWYGLDHAWQLPVYYARRAIRGAAHIARRPFRTGTAIALDPPDLWMIDHDA